MKQLTAEVISNKQILKELERPNAQTFKRPAARNISGSWLIWLNCPEIAAVARPGQFVMVNCGEDCYLPRPLSIHQVNNGNLAFFLAVWEGGKGTQWLSQRKVGDKIGIFGPLGNGFTIKPNSNNLLLVAGGTGIAPLCFLAEEALKKGHRVKLLHGVSGEYKPSGEKNPPQHYPKRLLPRGITEVRTITSSRDGLMRMVVDLLKKPGVVDWADQVFACGPVPMYRAMAKIPELKNKVVQLSMEIMMGCGTGVCYGCTIKTKSGLKQVCKDGPVFEMGEVDWDNSLGI